MKHILVVVDIQKDFVDGSLGTDEAMKIVPTVVDEIENFDGDVVFTLDTHSSIYLETQEGKNLPVPHCIKGTDGWRLDKNIEPLSLGRRIFEKPTFGSVELANFVADGDYDDISLIGLCTDICVVSNALLMIANFLETKVSVDASCCAGVTVDTHNASLPTMKMCQINVVGE